MGGSIPPTTTNKINLKWAGLIALQFNKTSMKLISIFYRTKKIEIPEISNKMNLVNEIYYDTEWWEKKWALEWWARNGQFNEELYRNILLAKLDSLNELSNKK